MLSHLLKLDHHQIAAAADGLAGLSFLEQENFDVALVDVGLPGLDGFEVARRARKLPHQEALLIVALTGYGRPEDRRAVQEAGFDLHVVKPFKLADLQAALLHAGDKIKRQTHLKSRHKTDGNSKELSLGMKQVAD